MADADAKIREYVSALYGADRADGLCAAIAALIARMPPLSGRERYRFSAADTVLISYGHGLQCRGQAPFKNPG